jgi:hypothetical protein
VTLRILFGHVPAAIWRPVFKRNPLEVGLPITEFGRRVIGQRTGGRGSGVESGVLCDV